MSILEALHKDVQFFLSLIKRCSFILLMVLDAVIFADVKQY